MDESNEFLVILDPSSEKTPKDMQSIMSTYPDNRPVFDNAIAIYSDDNFQKVMHDMTTLLYGREFLINEVSGNIFGQGYF